MALAIQDHLITTINLLYSTVILLQKDNNGLICDLNHGPIATLHC